MPVLSCLGSTIPLAHGLEGCSLALLVLILEEKYFKEHLITVQSAVLLKMPLGLMEGRSWMGEPCLCRTRLSLSGGTGLGSANPRCGGHLDMVQSQPWVWGFAWALGECSVVVPRAECVDWDCH